MPRLSKRDKTSQGDISGKRGISIDLKKVSSSGKKLTISDYQQQVIDSIKFQFKTEEDMEVD